LSTVLRIPAKAAAERRVRWTALLSVERAQFFLWLPVLFAAAIGLYFSLPVEPPPLASVPFFAIAALLWAATWRRRWMHYPAIALTVLCCGFLVAQGRTALVASPALERGLDPVMLEGEILALQPRAGVTRVVLHCLVIDGLPPDRTPQRVRIRLGAKMAEGVQPGRRVRLRVVLRPPPEPTAPGAFDFARQAYFERLGAVGFALSPPRPVSSEGQAGGPLSTQWRIFWEGARFAIAQRVRTVLGGETGALAVALMTGIKGELSAATTAAMRVERLFQRSRNGRRSWPYWVPSFICSSPEPRCRRNGRSSWSRWFSPPC
jgi:competence protein ComEC